MTTQEILQGVHNWTKEKVREVVDGENIPSLAYNLEAWADQKAIATPDTYTDAVRTTGGDIPIETSAGSKLESIKPVAGSKWTAKMLFNGSYNMLNAAKWGAANSQPYVGGVGSNFVYFLVPELTLGTFGTADENNGLLFTDEDGVNVQPASVYFKPLGSTVPQSLTDGTSISPTSVSYDGKTYKDYATSGAGWLIVPKTIYDNDVCPHIAWEDWYDKHVSLNALTTNPEAVVGILMLEGLLALAHSDKYLRGVNDEVCDNVAFGDTSATVTHMVDELSVAANAWTNAATGESDSQGNALYRHSATVSGIKQGGAACVEGNNGGIPLTVNGTTVSYVDTNATVTDAQTVFYQIPTTEEITRAYSHSVFDGSNINQETGVLPINDCSIEAQVAMSGMANITVKYAKNIVDQVAINAATDVPKLQEQVEEHEERITELEDTAVRTGSYDASVAVGLADNFKGDTIVEAEFYKRKTGGTQSVGSGIAAIKEVRGKSIVWNQLANNVLSDSSNYIVNGSTTASYTNGKLTVSFTETGGANAFGIKCKGFVATHKYLFLVSGTGTLNSIKFSGATIGTTGTTIDTLVSTIFTQLQSYTNGIIWFWYSGSSVTTADMILTSVNLFDLTLIFGAGNEPATVAEFEKMFPLDYYDYNEGEVIPFAGQNLVTTGFNQWDEQWELGAVSRSGNLINDVTRIRPKNYIPVLPNTTYKFTCSGFEDKRKNIIYYNKRGDTKSVGSVILGGQYQEKFTTSPTTNFIKFSWENSAQYGSTYNHDICINISDEDRNGTYEPYEKHTLPLNPSQWRDKQGNLVFPYGGMHGVGTAYDYAKVDADGYIRKAVRACGQIDMGSANWEKQSSSVFAAGYFFITDFGDVLKSNTNVNDCICPKYIYTNIMTPKEGAYGRYNKTLRVFDSSYDDATTFRNAMNGVMLIYELAEPVEVELATPVYAKYLVDKDGTEEITPANGTTPYTTMANLSILYAMDARGEIKNLPKNYISKESEENMLNAMVSAGIIASYTMTWDSTNNRYAFTFTKAEQASTNTVNNESNI